uniref:MARVEL domain-containing protein n=1 Tax=Arion vulgaris TaxID=1028688 RepID=A0A0B7A5I2_9EUPU
MESGDEPTEVTAMTSGESGVSSDDSVDVPLDTTNSRISTQHTKTLLKQYLRSPRGKCVFVVVVLTLLLLASYIMSKFVMGLMFMGSCHLEPFVPIYLVTSAALLVTFLILLVVIIIKCRREEGDDRVSPVHLVAFVYFFIHLVLQLAGSVCVIKTRNLLIDIDQDDTNETATCHDMLLTYSFGVVIFELILSGLLFIFAIISLCEVIYIECCQKPERSKPSSNR